MSDVGPGGQIAIHPRADLDAAPLGASALEISGAVVLIAGQRIGEIGGQGGLLVFDDQNQQAA